MPLTAIHAEFGLLDATDIAEAMWTQTVHRRGAPLRCSDCTGRMRALIPIVLVVAAVIGLSVV